MDKLPTELHMQIVAFCAEQEPSGSGQPGASVRALRHVSKYFCAVAHPWLYHTVAVHGVSQASQLVERLEAETSGRLRVQNLFLSDVSTVDNASASATMESSRTSKPQGTAPRLTRATCMSAPTLNTLTRLLTLCAPSLHVLSISITSSSSPTFFARLFRMTLPELRFLSISGFYPFPSVPRTLPKLTTLRLYGNPDPRGLLSMGALGDACPALDTLEVGGFRATSSFVKEVEQAIWAGILAKATPPAETLGSADRLRDASVEQGLRVEEEEEEEEEEEAFPPRLPKTVRKVVLQSLSAEQTSVRNQVGSASVPVHPHGVHLTVLPPAPTPSVDELRCMWMHRSATWA